MKKINQLKIKTRLLLIKLLRHCLNISILIIVSPFCILVMAISPLMVIRFGTLMSSRIGHFAADTEAYLCSKDIEIRSRVVIDIIGCSAKTCNHQLKTMWSRTLKLWPAPSLINAMDMGCIFWSNGSKKHHISLYNRGPDYRLFSVTRSHIEFTEQEEELGKKLMHELGIDPEKNWICIHNRDDAYLEALFKRKVSYHDYRNYSIGSMLKAAEALTKKNYYVIRVGSVVNERLNTKNQLIVDYANCKLRSDFLDVYILAKCKFFLGSESGIWAIPLIFRKPIALVNFTLLSNFYDKNYQPWYVILKHFWHKKLQRYLSIREIFELGLDGAGHSEIYEQADVKLIENSNQEIMDIAEEIEERTSGRWRELQLDCDLQNRFQMILRDFAPKNFQGEITIRIGTTFLRENSYLLN